MRHYIDIVEGIIPNTLVNRVSPFTAQSKQKDDYLTRIKKEIENEESGLLTGYGKYAEYSDFNKNSSGANTERNEHYMLIDKLRGYQQQAEKERRDAIIKNKQNRRAELIGYAQAGAEQYNDYMDIAQTHVAKMASKNSSKLEKQFTALKLMAQRTI
ncbi:hypothetical protein OAC11_03765 [Alphaproteobacteria bacterium]|nr:hypothetical protein [Alphaproteobacteria bacterium]